VKLKFEILFILLVAFKVTLLAYQPQNENEAVMQDSIFSKQSKKNTPKKNTVTYDTLTTENFKPDPERVIWMGAIIPGYGQFINRRYWKMPIVYAGFLGCTYAITWNSLRYQAYRNAYRDIIDTNESTTSYLDILPEGYTVDTYGGISNYTGILKTQMEKFRYNRDLSVIVTVAYYAITLVDAFVDAQLYDFDISPDLSLKLSPAIFENRYAKGKSAGLQLSLRIK
jgi:hypothetical protein